MKNKENKESLASNLIKMKRVKKDYQHLISEANRFEEMIFSEEERMIQTIPEKESSMKDNRNIMKKVNLRYMDSLNDNKIRSKYPYNSDEENLKREFESRQNDLNTRRIFFKKFDFDTSKGGKFSNKFKESLMKTKTKIDVIPPDLLIEDFTVVPKFELTNKKNISYDSNFSSLPVITSIKFNSHLVDEGTQNSLKYSHPQSKNIFYPKYNHNSHLKQKYLNHKKLFKNQEDIKKIYYVINNVQNDYGNSRKINFQNEEIRLREKNKNKIGTKKIIDYRKIFQERLADKRSVERLSVKY